ncbi:ankyrin repeat and EF-hand domain-containing protein 1a isoform X2 [Channa argus]|uniref:ankyrin repeat and EF-hand domain-containing protein 1a isoform X2 n=1 Tax=Channa argus TaxID=215402 RepID=UPI0035225D41
MCSSDPTMSGRIAEGRLEVLQIYRVLKCIDEVDKAFIEKMLKHGVENLINLSEPEDGKALLHAAVLSNNEDLVSFLLSEGAHPNIQDKQGRTPVMLAAELGNDRIVALLAQNNANMMLQDAEGKGVLFYCIYPTKCHIRCLQWALKCQADANNVSAEGSHVFQLMCEKAQECTPMCLIMLDAGADPNATNQKTGITALMDAARAGSVLLVRAILKRGGNPNALDQKRFTAVHYAAMGGFFEVIQALSAYSADMGVINCENCTALHYAAATGNAICCKFLAQRGCNPKLKNCDGLLPRQIAKDAGHKAAALELKKAEKLNRKGSESSSVSPMSDVWALNLHDWSHEFETELRQAIGDTSDTVTTEMFSSVLEALGAPVGLEQLQIIIAAHQGKDGCISVNEFINGVKYIKKPFLLSSYKPKEKKGKKGGKGSKKMGKFVLALPICTLPPTQMPRRLDGGPPMFMIEKYSNFSDICRFDSNNPPKHPLMDDSRWYMEKPAKVYVNINHCVEIGDMASLKLAFSQGVPVDVQDPYYKTPLMTACSSGNYEVAQYLLRADVNMCDQFFWTPLHHAAFAGQLDIVKLLVEAGAIIDAEGLCCGTPLMRAIESSRLSCVDYLIKEGASVFAQNKKGESCLDVARAFADARIIDLVIDKMESLPKKSGKGDKAQKPKSVKEKSVAVESVGPVETSTATVGKSPQKDSNSIILQNARITTGKSNLVDITFVPKTVWGKPATTSQLRGKTQRQKELLSLEMDFDDFMTPFSQSLQRT